MPPEYIPIQQEIDNLWWRVPLGFLPFFLIFLFFNHVNEIEIKLRSEGREDKDTPEHSLLVGPVAMAWLRVCALVAITRFAWIYFVTLDKPWDVKDVLFPLEGLALMGYLFLGLVFWVSVEMEHLDYKRICSERSSKQKAY